MRTRWYVLIFGLVGYLLVAWFFVVSPYEHTLKVLSFVCPACPIIETISPTWPAYLLIFAPINAGMYALVGFLLGKIVWNWTASSRPRQSGKSSKVQ